MNIVIVSATALEIEPFTTRLESNNRNNSHQLTTFITGIGQVSVAFRLTSFLAEHQPELMIQAGIAGSFDPSQVPGSVVAVADDGWADLGVEENKQWLDVFDMGLEAENNFPYSKGRLVNPQCKRWNKLQLQEVHAVTVNEIISKKERKALIIQKYHPAIESMEGAAFHFVCLHKNIPFLQLRSVSNSVGERDKQKWEMKKAIANLNESLVTLIENI